jgi:hypothetical protein
LKQFYCIIKGRYKTEVVDTEDNNEIIYEYGYWNQIVKDIIEAEDKESARKIVNKRYNNSEVIPMRYKESAIKNSSLLLSLYEIDDENSYFKKGFFDLGRECLICGKSYSVLDKYNLFGSFGVEEHCSPNCTKKEQDKLTSNYEEFNYSVPVVYKITQISTGRCYIGVTTRSFTLRWWEHIKRGNTEKFHSVLHSTNINDWTFQVVEELKKDDDRLERETYWIQHFNSVEEGFNSHVSKKEEK